MAFDLWMAPKVIDLQYMTCLPCDEGFFCAPGNRGERKIILFISPLSSQKNADKSSLTGCLAHEIAHHIIQDISRATILTMKRKEDFDLPMWLEEGLCQLIQSEVYPSLQWYFTEDIVGKVPRYPLEELWNDLSSCEDARTAYLQAYRETIALMAAIGKSGVIQLLNLNRTHDVNGMTCHVAGITEREQFDIRMLSSRPSGSPKKPLPVNLMLIPIIGFRNIGLKGNPNVIPHTFLFLIPGFVQALKEIRGHDILVPLNPHLTAALGAAIIAIESLGQLY